MRSGITLVSREAALQEEVYPREGSYFPRFISPASEFAVGPLLNQHQSHVDLSFATAAVWPAANRALAFPFYAPANMTLVDAWVWNGATVANNIDIGIYDSAFVRVVSTGSVAMAGASAIQVVALADTKLYGGKNYWMAMNSDSATATFMRDTLSGSTTNAARCGCWQQANASVVLPDPATPANFASSYCPFFGFTTETSW